MDYIKTPVIKNMIYHNKLTEKKMESKEKKKCCTEEAFTPKETTLLIVLTKVLLTKKGKRLLLDRKHVLPSELIRTVFERKETLYLSSDIKKKNRETTQ